jgi:hypothetical protein
MLLIDASSHFYSQDTKAIYVIHSLLSGVIYIGVLKTYFPNAV